MEENWEEQTHAEDLERLRSADWYTLATVMDGRVSVSSIVLDAVAPAHIKQTAGAVIAEAQWLQESERRAALAD